jgi:hypothetical protein
MISSLGSKVSGDRVHDVWISNRVLQVQRGSWVRCKKLRLRWPFTKELAFARQPVLKCCFCSSPIWSQWPNILRIHIVFEFRNYPQASDSLYSNDDLLFNYRMVMIAADLIFV